MGSGEIEGCVQGLGREMRLCGELVSSVGSCGGVRMGLALPLQEPCGRRRRRQVMAPSEPASSLRRAGSTGCPSEGLVPREAASGEATPQRKAES